MSNKSEMFSLLAGSLFFLNSTVMASFIDSEKRERKQEKKKDKLNSNTDLTRFPVDSPPVSSLRTRPTTDTKLADDSSKQSLMSLPF